MYGFNAYLKLTFNTSHFSPQLHSTDPCNEWFEILMNILDLLDAISWQVCKSKDKRKDKSLSGPSWIFMNSFTYKQFMDSSVFVDKPSISFNTVVTLKFPISFVLEFKLEHRETVFTKIHNYRQLRWSCFPFVVYCTNW